MLHTFQAIDFSAPEGAHQRSRSMPLQMTASAIRKTNKRTHRSSPLSDPYKFASPAIQRRERKVSQSSNGFSLETNRLFGATQLREQVFCYSQSARGGSAAACDFDIVCKMERGFFLVDGRWTCYRRNYFQLSCSLLLKNFATHHTDFHVNKDGSACAVKGFYFRLKARLHSRADQPIKLIQLTPKRDKGPQLETPLLPVQPNLGPAWMNSMLTASSDAALGRSATFDRIQFKQATANNGKKRASQQYYVLVVELLGLIDGNNGEEYITLASCESEPLVVRGRSPGHYAEYDNSKNIITSSIGDVNDTPAWQLSNNNNNNNNCQPALPLPPPSLLNYGGSPQHARSVSYNDGYYWLHRQDWQYPYPSNSSPKSTPGLLWSPHERDDSAATGFITCASVSSLPDNSNDQTQSYFWPEPWSHAGASFSSSQAEQPYFASSTSSTGNTDSSATAITTIASRIPAISSRSSS